MSDGFSTWMHDPTLETHFSKDAVPAAWMPQAMDLAGMKLQPQTLQPQPLPQYAQHTLVYANQYMQGVQQPAAAAVAAVQMLLSPVPPRDESPSRASSPFSTPVALGWGDGSESESAAESLHSGSGSGHYSSSGVTTPYESQVHSPTLTATAPPTLHTTPLPTINELTQGLLRPHTQLQVASSSPRNNMHLSTDPDCMPDIGFLPLHSMDASIHDEPPHHLHHLHIHSNGHHTNGHHVPTPAPSLASATSLSDLPGRAKPRNRYTTAAAASAAARASISQTPSPPREYSSSASGHSSADEEAERHTRPAVVPVAAAVVAATTVSAGSAHNSQAKRKRVASRKASAAAADEGADEDGSEYGAGNMSPVAGGAGLDKRARNKLSASQYRKRRKMYLDSLEGRVGELDGTIQQQAAKMQEMSAENQKLKEQLSLFKRMLQKINPSLVADAESPRQSTLVHHGGRTPRGGAGAFLLALVSCILLCMFMDPTAQLASGPQVTAPMGMAGLGRRGRSLLSVEEPMMMHPSAAELPSLYLSFESVEQQYAHMPSLEATSFGHERSVEEDHIMSFTDAALAHIVSAAPNETHMDFGVECGSEFRSVLCFETARDIQIEEKEAS